MAMLPFCGYNMADYWAHWIRIGQRPGARLPRIYLVNWFRKSADGDFLWPGYGDNSRVLRWIFERCEGTAKAQETAIGNLPLAEDLDLSGVDVDPDDLRILLSVDRGGWLQELPLIREFYARFGARLPAELAARVDQLEMRLR
jgi:phosphoenolpyruvate carboxykinase (GTP)